MKKFKSMLAFVMAFMLVVGSIPFTAFAANEKFGFTDFPTGWSEAAMTDAVENGLITGYGDNTVRPKDLLTRAMMAAIINRAFGAEISADIEGKFSDVNPDDWFYDDIAKAVNMRTFTGYEDGTMHPNDYITREDAILVIARALVINSEDESLLDKFSDKSDIAGYAKGAIATFVLRDYIHGYEDGTILPKNNITREEFAQIMYNIFAAYERTSGAVSLGDCEGEVILTGDNVHLYSTNIDGDLIIGDGVGATNVYLENVNVKGRIVFRGGEGYVTLRNVTLGDLIVTNDVNGTVNFYHYSTEPIFRNAVYNTPATFLDRTVPGGTASGTGLGKHDTHVEGRNDANTGVKEEQDKPVINPNGGKPATRFYDITLDPQNGSAPTEFNDIKSGESLASSGHSMPADPVKDGYKFDGWFYDKNGTETPFDENTIITSAISVYAKWQPGVFFYEDDTFATQFGTEIYVDMGDTLGTSFPTAAPTKTGHTFAGWVYMDGAVEKSLTYATVIDAHIKAYPTWTKNTYTVTFYNKGAQYATQNVLYGEQFTAAMMPADPTGVGFEGWYYDDDNDATTPDVIFTAPVTVTANITVNAKWAETYTVTYYVDGTQYDQKDNILAGGNVGTLPTDPSKSGYVFKGWVYSVGSNEYPFTATTQIYSDFIVNAKFVKLHTVTFLDDKGGAVFATDTIEDGETASLPTAEPTKTGHTFLKWVYEDGTEKDFDPANVTGDVTVYPAWTKNTHTVTFYNKGAQYAMQTVLYGEQFTAAMMPADPTGVGFEGWYFDDDNDATTPDVIFTAPVTVTSDIAVNAKWAETYTVTYYVDGTQYDQKDNILAGGNVGTLPTEPSKSDYVFKGWFYDLGGVETAFDATTPIYADTTVNAKFAKLHTVTFLDDKGGAVFATDTVEDGQTANLPTAEPTKTGHTFLKWVYEDGTEKDFDPANVTGDVTVYPAWGRNTYTVTFYNKGAQYATESIAYGGQFTAAMMPADPSGVGFEGWYYDDDNDATTPDVIFTAPVTVTYDITVNAKWAETYTVTYIVDGSTYDTKDNILSGETVGTLPTEPSKSDYVFKGWFYDVPGVETEFTAATQIYSDLTVTAKFAKLHTVTFLDDKGGAVFATDVVEHGGTATIPVTPPTKAGHVFGGWVYDDNGTDTGFDPTNITSDVTVYPAWGRNTYTVTFYNKGAQYATESIAYGEQFTAAMMPADPTGVGFEGWYYDDDNDATTPDVIFTAPVTVTSDITVNAKWAETYTVTYIVDGATHDTKTNILSGETVGTLPTEPSKSDYVFKGWFYDLSGTETEFTAATQIYSDLTVTAKFVKLYTVTFYEFGYFNRHSVTVEEKTTVAESEIATADGALWVPNESGYKANMDEESYISNSTVARTHQIPGQWYYNDGTGYVPFDETVVVESDIDVYYYFNTMYALINLESMLGDIGKYTFEVFYGPETLAVESILDGLWLNKAAFKTLILNASKPIFGKNIKFAAKGYAIDYTPVNEKGEIMNLVYDYRLIDLLGEATIREYTHDAVVDMVKGDEDHLRVAIDENLIKAADPANNALRETIDDFVMSDAVVKAEFITRIKSQIDRTQVKQEIINEIKSPANRPTIEAEVKKAIRNEIKTANPSWADQMVDDFIAANGLYSGSDFDDAVNDAINDAVAAVDDAMINDAIDAAVNDIMADRTKRLEAIQKALSDPAIRDMVADVMAIEIKSRITADEDCPFTDEVVELAKKAYDNEIETFISQLKNDDAYLINVESDGTDRRFIIDAISKKLSTVTFAEIKGKLPEAIFKILDEAKIEEIFDRTLADYITQVDAVKTAVWATGYAGEKYYVSSSVPVIINPVTDGLIPMYDKAFAKLDPKVKGFKYYTQNPFIAELEALAHYKHIITTVATPSEGASGYALFMNGGNINAETYFTYIYKLAVLTYDAAEWFVENVPENELDDAIHLMADRIGGYYDKLEAKFSFLTSDKAQKAEGKAYELIEKIADKDTESIWNTPTSKLIDEKINKGYDKACEVIIDKTGFDPANDIEIEISSDCKTVTLTQGTRVVTKTINDIAKDIEKKGHTVSVNGSVITIDGTTKIDVADYIKKLADKFGYSFTVSLKQDAAELANPQVLYAYIFSANVDSIKLQIRLK